MKVFAYIAAFFVCASHAFAASVTVGQLDVPSGSAFSISADPTGLSDVDTFIIDITPEAGAEFLNFNDTGLNGFFPLVEGDDASFISALVSFPAPQGRGFTNLISENSPTRIAFTTGPLGGLIDSELFIGQVVLPAGASGSASVQFIAGGQILDTIVEPLGSSVVIPEPASLALLGLGFAGVVARRRRG